MNLKVMLSNNKNRFYGVNSCKYITIHETANNKKGANAINHAKYMNGASTETWHYTVDDKQVVKHFADHVQCWHSGDGKGLGNTASIGIELCVNEDGNFKKTVKNAQELVLKLMKEHNIKVDHIVQHNHWSGKNCPTNLRNGSKGVTWNQFIKPFKPSKKVVKETKKVTQTIKDSNINDLVARTIRGEFGNGSERKLKLGLNYEEVQKRINKLYTK